MLRRLWELVNPRGRGALGTYVRVALFWNPLVAVIFAFLFAERPGERLEQFLVSITIGTTALTFAFATVHLFRRIDDGVRRRRGLPPRERGVGQTALVAGASLPAGVYLGYALVTLSEGRGWPDVSNIGYGIIIGVTALLAFSLAESLGALREARHLAELRRRDADNARLRGQLAALTAQMNPHLLFNTLNTIASLTQTDPDAAEDTTVELAHLYRGVLSASRLEAHSLADELEICRAYLTIEAARFGPRLCHVIELDPSVDPEAVLVPPLLVQPLVENAVKHGIGPEEGGGEVRVDAHADGGTLCIEVRDDGVGFDPTRAAGAHESTGLDNCRKRLSLLHAEDASLEIEPAEGGGTEVRVRLPLILREAS